MGNVKKRFVVDLTLNTKDAEKQLKATAGNIKTILADMGKASDKMGYFKELVDYIKQIDNAMTALKNKDPMKFNDLFDGLDGNLKQTFESLFGMASKDMSVLDELRNKLKSLDSGKAGVGELRNMAQEINSLFVTLGKAPPLDIDKHFTDRGDAAARIKMLTDQVENFATVWVGVSQKVQQGFGGSGTGLGGGSGVGGDLSQEVQQQIDALEEQINQYQLLLSKLNEINKMKSTLDNGKNIQLDFEATEESARELISRFTQMYDALQDMDKESTEYAASLAECAKVALQLDQLNTNLTKKDKLGNVVKSSPKFLRDFIDGDSAAYVLEDFEFEFKDIQKIVQNAISDAKHQIEQLKIDASKIVPKGQPGTGGGTGTGSKGSDGTGTGNGASTSVTVDGPIDVDFTSLENTIKSEMASINAKLDDVLKVELVKDDTKDISSAIESIKANVDQISSLVKSYQASNANTAAQAEVDNMKNNLSQFLKVVSDFNNRKTQMGTYQHQEIGAAILSDGSISAGYGEHGSVPWDRMANSLLGNLTKSLLVDVHSHPWAEFYNGKKYANDSFSGSSGDLGAFRRSKELGAQMAAMITGNIMRTLDLSKLTDAQMKQFKSALDSIEKKYANTPEYSQYMSYDSQTDSLYYKRQSNIAEQHKVTEAFESLMYKAFEQIGFSKNQVDQEIFKKYNLTDDAQLTELAERLVQLSHASQDALSPVERLSQIVSQFGGDTSTDKAKAALKAYEKGERSAADVFNLLNTKGYTLNQDTIDSLMHIDTASEMPIVESLLTKISSVLDAINTNIVSIENNTRLTTDQQTDHTIDSLTNIKNGLGLDKYFTSDIQSIFDASNISEFKNKEVLSLTDEAVTNFQASLNDLVDNGVDDIDITQLQHVMENFKLAISYVQDATKQITLYQERTGVTVKDGYDDAEDTLSKYYSELTDQNILNQLVSLLHQTKSGANTDQDVSNKNFVAISQLDDNITLLTRVLQTGSVHDILAKQASAFDSADHSRTYAETLYDYAGTVFSTFHGTLKDLSERMQNGDEFSVAEMRDLFERYSAAITRISDAQMQIDAYERYSGEELVHSATGELVSYGVQSMRDLMVGNDGSIIQDMLSLMKNVRQGLMVDADGTPQSFDNTGHISDLMTALITLTNTIESLILQLRTDNGGISPQNTQSRPVANVSIDGTDLTSEISQCQALLDIIDQIRWAVQWKTDAFENENNTVQTIIPLEINALKELEQYLDVLRSSITSLFDNISAKNGIFTSWKDDLLTVEGHIQNILGLLQQINTISGTPVVQVNQVADGGAVQPEKGYALESTLLTTNSILTQILTAVGNNESIDQLVEPLKKAVLELKTVASGIVQYQKTQQPKLLAAKDRIASDYEGISNRAKNTVANLGDEVKIKQLSALENGIVRVEGATRDANGVWKGFIVDIDEANNTTIKAINEQSKFATSLNKSAEEAARLKQEAQDVFNKNMLIQTDAFEEYKRDLEVSGNLTDELRIKLDALENQLKQIGDSTGLEIWQNQFTTFQKTADKTAEVLTQQRIGAANQFKKDLNVDLGKLDFQIDNGNLTLEQERIAQAYREVSDELEEYITNVKLGNKVEITGIEQKIIALKAQTKAYRDAHNIVNARGGKAKAYGSKEVSNATTQFSGLTNRVNADFVDNAAIKAQLQALEASYNNLINLQKQFKVGEVISDQQEQDFKIALKQYQDLEKGLTRLINTYSKYKDVSAIKDVSSGFVNTNAGREAELRKQVAEFEKSFPNATVTIDQFKDDYNTLLFTIDKGNGVIDKMKASFDEAKQSIIITSKSAVESTGWLSQAWNDLKSKTVSLAKYYISSLGIQEVIQVVRKGITYVREIDAALTELKKVTNETNAAYDSFLSTASKTAGKLGSTVSDFVNATADFARLGYNIKEASSLAEAASVYKNVGDGITDVAQASESIISTMKAFGIEANDAMGIVDRFNEVGKLIA